MAYNPSTVLKDAPQLDAFTRLRVSEPVTVFETQTQYDIDPIRLEAGVTGVGVAATWSSVTRIATLKINAGGAGGSSFLQSYQYVPYKPGKGQLIVIAGNMGSGTAGAVKRYGYGDAANGIFYEQNGTTGIQFNYRTSTSGATVNNTVPQLSWNIDKFNGTGPSGFVLDVTKNFSLVIDFQLMSRVRVGFRVNGSIFYAHEFLNANVLDLPFMQTDSLPVLAEIVAAAALAAAAQTTLKDAVVTSEGGILLDLGRQFCSPNVLATAAATRTHAMSIRLKSLFNGVTNRVGINFTGLELISGVNPVFWELCIGAAFSVLPTYADVNPNSGVEVGTGGTFANLTNGIVIRGGFLVNGGGSIRLAIAHDFNTPYPISLNKAGAHRDLGTLTLLLTSLVATSACNCVLNWEEIR